MIATVIDLKNGLMSCETNVAGQGPDGQPADAPAVNNKDEAATRGGKRRDSFLTILLRSLSAVAI